MAKSSRTREAAVARATGLFREPSNNDNSDTNNGNGAGGSAPNSQRSMLARSKKRLRYHILVDSGMGRLGFKTQAVEVSDVGVRGDTVEIISELVEMEVAGAPVGKNKNNFQFSRMVPFENPSLYRSLRSKNIQ